ncbi:MAG: biopolymer transporter ExbD [Candidatus Omnitrophota bacterium]
MRFKSRVCQERDEGIFELTPLINIFFLLLIFFMFTSSFIFQPGIRVNLPKAVTSEVLAPKEMTIIIDKSDVIYLNDRPISAEELTSNLSILAKENTQLLIKADRNSSLGMIVHVLDVCRSAGLSQINIATSKGLK